MEARGGDGERGGELEGRYEQMRRSGGVLTKSGNVPVNTAKQSSSRAAVSNSTAEYVNTVASRPTMNGAKLSSNVFHQSHSLVKRTIYQRTTPKNSDFKEKVNTAKVNNVTILLGQKHTPFLDDAGKKNDAQYPAKDGDKNGHEKDVRNQEKALRKQFDQETKRLVGQREATITNSTNRLNIVSPSVSADGQSFDNNDLPTDPLMPDLEDFTGIFRGAYDIEDVGAEVDLNNLETTMNFKPKKVIQALIDQSWIEAMQEELLQFILQKVWTLVDLPKGKRSIGTKWVYRNKKDERGIVVRNKARLMDVKSAFLYGTIEEEVYVCQPPSFEDPQFPDKVYKVEKALYGLHQAPRAWYETLSTYLIENGFRRGTIDKTLFIKKDKDDAQEIPDEFYGGAHFLLRVTSTTEEGWNLH
ncbi:putative ribonuclease H-like domain-containing protein [Tanacetum coccineum]